MKDKSQFEYDGTEHDRIFFGTRQPEKSSSDHLHSIDSIESGSRTFIAITRSPLSKELSIEMPFEREEAEDLNSAKSKDRAFREDAILKGFADYPYCLVMPDAGQSLQKKSYCTIIPVRLFGMRFGIS